MRIIQTLRFKRVQDYHCVYECIEDSGEKILTLPMTMKGGNKGKHTVNFRETINPLQKRNFPYLISTNNAKTICGVRTVSGVYGYSYSDINGKATMIETDYHDNLSIYILDNPKSESAEIFKEWINGKLQENSKTN